MRYFTYISDSKVNMLLPQIPTAVKKSVSAEIGFDIKVLSGKIATERNALEDRIHRLLAVEKHIRRTQTIGSMTEPKSWIEGQGLALMSHIKEDDDAIFFFMHAGGGFLALGGSAGHLVGFDSKKSLAFGMSHAPFLLRNLQRLDTTSELFDYSDEVVAGLAGSGVHDGEHSWCRMVYYVCHGKQAKSFTLPISFLARTLVSGSYQNQPVVLATPLFVEQSD